MLDLERLDNLPQRESVRKKDRKWYKNRNNGVWKTTKRIINANIGKSYDNAYSIFCKKLKPWQDRSYFTDEFTHRRSYYTISYHIDNNGLIQKTTSKKSKKPVYIYSDDYKIEYVHKETGILQKQFDVVEEVRDKRYKRIYMIPSLYCYKNKKDFDAKWWFQRIIKTFPMFMWVFAKPENFEERIISGSVQIFTSKRDYRYIRHQEDKRKQKHALSNKEYRISLQERLEKDRVLMRERKRKEKEANNLKILAAGFDLKTSFRNKK